MKIHALGKLQQQLLEMRSRIVAEVEQLKEAPSAQGADSQIDPGSKDAAEEIALALQDAEGRTLAEVESALERLDRNTYGTCEACRKPIAIARLNTVPYARHCSRCARSRVTG